jgi:hypothetical protein
MPFRVYADLTRDFEVAVNDKFQLRFDPPEAITRTIFQPESCSVKTARRPDGLTLVLQGDGLTLQLEVRVPPQVTLTVPSDALPGYHAVSVASLGVLGVKRFLVVE